MSRFARASHVIWHCQYHMVWVPKYRYRILQGPVGKEVYKCIMVFCQQLGCEVVELNVQADHVHLLVKIPPKHSVSELMGILKGRTAIRLFSSLPFLKKRPYWGNHFWAQGYCVDTVGLNSEMIQKYVWFQEKGRSASGTAATEAGQSAFSEGALGVLPSGERKTKPRSMNVVHLFNPCWFNSLPLGAKAG